MQHPPPSAPMVTVLEAELLGEAAFDLASLAHACRQNPDWVRLRVNIGVLQVHLQGAEWRFSSQTLVRATRLAQLEAVYDADPQLAALTVDLIEEVNNLRQQLQRLRQG